MPIPHGRTVNVLPDINKPSLLNASSQLGCNLIKSRSPKGVPDVAVGEKNVGPGTTCTGKRDTIVVAEESGTDFSELDVTVSGTAEDAVHFADGGWPI